MISNGKSLYAVQWDLKDLQKEKIWLKKKSQIICLITKIS